MPLNIPPPFSCPIPVVGPRNFTVTLPGGVQIGAFTSDLYASQGDIVRQMLGMVQLALAPFKVVFDIIGAVLAIKRILDAVPDVVTNPAKIVQELKAAAKLFVDLAKNIPQVSVPILAGSVLDLIVLVLRDLMIELDNIALKEQDIVRLQTMILSKADPLGDVLACAEQMNRQRLCAIEEACAPLDVFFQMLNLFLGLAGIPPMPTLGELGHSALTARTRLAQVIDIVEGTRRAIPTPRLAPKPRC
jgi:hypothetical protein